jgi:SAM-dependent methyltransferase
MADGQHGPIKLAIRRLLPEWIKTVLRLVRLAATPLPPWPPRIPQAQLDGCVVLESRLAMLDRLERGLTICEVGTAAGGFAAEILARCAPASLHSIDIDLSQVPDALKQDARLHTHLGLSQDVIRTFPDETFDIIYIDADHSYAAVRNDIAAAVPKLKPGGLLAFNDFAIVGRWGFGQFGVKRAVSEFAVEAGWPMVYFCFDPQALYDVALRKPGGSGARA